MHLYYPGTELLSSDEFAGGRSQYSVSVLSTELLISNIAEFFDQYHYSPNPGTNMILW